MRTLDEYLSLDYKIEITPDKSEGGYVVSFPDLPGCLSCGDTIEVAIQNASDAKKSWLEAALCDGIAIPEPSDSESYSGQFKLRIPKSLHKQLAEHSKKENISMNQYCLYLLSKNDALFSHVAEDSASYKAGSVTTQK
ncbi:MAG: type II toxin-antitoxin system HicB family antitoxin [Lachnospiraceae bacterium]|jgi:predicted RNase H-like HicB family nuclease|nr:type II toxin-antitoxin system HicB family antitoxin [Lachnospiraceae bacterium]